VSIAFTVVLNSYWHLLVSMFNYLRRIEDYQLNNLKGSKVTILDVSSNGTVLGKEKEGIFKFII
jgi:hypothetical protein